MHRYHLANLVTTCGRFCLRLQRDLLRVQRLGGRLRLGGAFGLFHDGSRLPAQRLVQVGLEISDSAWAAGRISELSTAKSPSAMMPSSRIVAIDDRQTPDLTLAPDLGGLFDRIVLIRPGDAFGHHVTNRGAGVLDFGDGANRDVAIRNRSYQSITLTDRPHAESASRIFLAAPRMVISGLMTFTSRHFKSFSFCIPILLESRSSRIKSMALNQPRSRSFRTLTCSAQ